MNLTNNVEWNWSDTERHVVPGLARQSMPAGKAALGSVSARRGSAALVAFCTRGSPRHTPQPLAPQHHAGGRKEIR